MGAHGGTQAGVGKPREGWLTADERSPGDTDPPLFPQYPRHGSGTGGTRHYAPSRAFCCIA